LQITSTDEGIENDRSHEQDENAESPRIEKLIDKESEPLSSHTSHIERWFIREFHPKTLTHLIDRERAERFKR
jgi:hypothetical protein